MNKLSVIIVTVLFGGLVSFSDGVRATSVEKTPPAELRKTLGPSPSESVIVPHRAIYDMSLASAKNGSTIAGVSGRMAFEWADVCDGWAVQQHLKLHFSYSGGTESNVTSSELTWESKDGKSYNFNIHRVTDDKDAENYRGKASLNNEGGTVVYLEPANKTLTLPAATMFPSAHTQMILQKAKSGDHFFSRRVFDGSDETGSNDVSAFIDPQPAHLLDANLATQLKGKALLDGPVWPVRMAFFKIDTETGEPDYEMDISLLANGIVQSMRIDYGDFSVLGTLSAIDPLPVPHC